MAAGSYYNKNTANPNGGKLSLISVMYREDILRDANSNENGLNITYQ